MTRRAGATLLEVLVAIFVMGIGMMALLTLFPIGILTMRQAVQDDRCSSSGGAATAIAKVTITPSLFDKWFTQADWDPPQANALASAPSDRASYALFLDTVGKNNYLAPFKDWVGGATGNLGGIRRLGFPNPTTATNTDALNWQISPDDIRFETVAPNYGLPTQIAANVFERNSTYSWAFLMRRPINGKPNVVDLTIVVFNDRPLALNGALQAGESIYNATFNPASNLGVPPVPNLLSNSVRLTWAGPSDLAASPPPISVGSWIMDSTPTKDSAGTPKFGPSHARFYRVVSIVQNATAANGQESADLELQSPIKDFPLLNPPVPATPYAGTVVIIEGIAEVFEKGPVEFQNP